MSSGVYYRSKAERKLHEGDLKNLEYEPKWAVVEYSSHHKYTPDYVHPSEPHVYYEFKGWFRSSAEAAKYKWIIASNPHLKIRFILQNPNKPTYKGCKSSMSDWCDRYGFEWCHWLNIPASWRYENVTK